jgi:hypothetical protein
MKFYKRLPLDSKNIQSNTFAVESDGQIVTDTKVSLQVPVGTNGDRPVTFKDGQIRYSSTLNEYEIYNGSGDGQGWEIIRTIRPAKISVNDLGFGDYEKTVFGPLQYSTGELYENFQNPQNILVFVENVFQIPGVNYQLIQDLGGVAIEFIISGTDTPPPSNKKVIALLGFDGYYPPFNS